MKKRFIATLVIAMLTAVMIAACGNSQQAETGPTGEGYEPGPRARYTEEVVIRIVKAIPASPNLPVGDTAYDNALTRHLNDVLNVSFELMWEVPESAYMERMALALVSGDMPDFIDLTVHNYLFFRQLADNDMLTDLLPYYETFIGETVRRYAGFDGMYDGRNLDALMDDGRLLAFAGTRFGYDVHNMLWMRQDWLEDAGLSQPSTLAEFENVLTTWRDNPPADNYLGLILVPSSMSAVAVGSPSPIFAHFGAFPGLWVRDANDDIIWGSVAPETRAGLEVLARWYADGLIDTQFAARDGGDFFPMFTAGQTGAMFAPWWTPYALGDFPHMNPGGEVAVLNAPVDPAGRFSIPFPDPTGHLVMVRNGFEHPEALFKVMNVSYDAWMGIYDEGFEAIQPLLEAGSSVGYSFPTAWFNIAPPDVVPHTGRMARTFVHTGGFGDLVIPDEFARSTSYAAHRHFHYGSLEGTDWIEFHARYMAAYIASAPEVNPIHPAFSFQTPSHAHHGTSLSTLETTTFLQIIMGELPIEAFDEFVANWYAGGGQILTDEVRASVAAR
ncbi:MAG: extracellular solute-binding protein [Defluviitaleaceae bacterium]|nr:extracellular solute-binding protein [Defluviitaleaceae bacterium]